MSVRRVKRRDPETGAVREYWMVDVDYQHPDGRRTRIRKVSPVQTRRGAEQYERDLRQAIVDGTFGEEKEVPTFGEWFNGRFWREWVVARKNKPSEVEAKRSIYRVHLEGVFGSVPIGEVGERIPSFRASLVEAGLSEKRINNILAVLSKALHYAEEARVIDRAPKVGLFRIERPEILCWEPQEYARLLAAARNEGSIWYAAVCLAGEAGLRVGEVKAIRWREDVDLVAATITVNRQMRRGIIGTPKGGRRRTVPMTERLLVALRAISEIREGLVFHGPGGGALSDGQAQRGLDRICRLAGLPGRPWHILRHSFGTHAAMFGANAWSLMTWMGHRRIEETLRYVNLANAHRRPTPETILAAANSELDPDRRVLKMLSARGNLTATAEGPKLELVRDSVVS